MKWEYTVYPISDSRDEPTVESAFNELGQGGWELGATYTQSGNSFCVFKRPIAR